VNHQLPLGTRLVSCTQQTHGAAILEIFNDVILNSTALYEYAPRTIQTMETWFGAKTAAGFPVIGLESSDGTLLGFASYGAFRVQPAYKYTVEHSVYVHPEHRGKGFGKVLLREIIAAAQADGRQAVIGAIDANNQASIALHQQFGFQLVGSLPQVGFKFGGWLDLVLYQLTLPVPQNPTDG